MSILEAEGVISAVFDLGKSSLKELVEGEYLQNKISRQLEVASVSCGQGKSFAEVFMTNDDQESSLVSFPAEFVEFAILNAFLLMQIFSVIGEKV